MSKVVVLTGYSLLAQGIISNLRKSSHSLEVEALDVRSANFIETLVQMQPEVVVMESSLQQAAGNCSLTRLFEALPNLIILEVNLKNSSVRLIRSDLYDASGFAGFLNVLENVRTNLRDVFISMPTMQHE